MTRLSAEFVARLPEAAKGDLDITSVTDDHGTTVLWCELADRDDLLPLATLLKDARARLAMMTSDMPPEPEKDEDAEEEEDDEAAEDGETAEETAPEPPALTFGGTPLDGTSYEIVYHFDINGDSINLIVHVPHGGALPSLTPMFRTADWPEREIMEIYQMVFTDHPNPTRLFLDESIDSAVLERLIPFSTLVNAASTKDLWAKVTAAAKAGEQ